MNFIKVKQQSIDTQKVASLLKDETKKLENINSLFKNETSKQQDDIMKRLMNRKNKQNTKSLKENMIDNIVNIVKRKESVAVSGRRSSRAFDTNVLEHEYTGTEEKILSQNSPMNSPEQRKKSIAMLKRASRDFTAFVEKRMSKLNVMEIEKAVEINRAKSIQKHRKHFSFNLLRLSID